MTKVVLAFLFALLSLAAPQVFAAAPDFSSLTDAVDFSTVKSGLLLIFAALAGVGIIWTGGGFIVSKIFRGK